MHYTLLIILFIYCAFYFCKIAIDTCFELFCYKNKIAISSYMLIYGVLIVLIYGHILFTFLTLYGHKNAYLPQEVTLHICCIILCNRMFAHL